MGPIAVMAAYAVKRVLFTRRVCLVCLEGLFVPRVMVLRASRPFNGIAAYELLQEELRAPRGVVFHADARGDFRLPKNALLAHNVVATASFQVFGCVQVFAQIFFV